MTIASAEIITELVRAHASGDERRWRNLLSQLIAAESRAGHVRQASRLRQLLLETEDSRPARSHGNDAGRPIQLARAPRDLADVLDIKYSEVRLRDLVLPATLRTSLQRVLDEQRLADRLAEHGLIPRRRLLLYGPPGCGKTMTANAIAGELKLPLARIRLEVLFSKYLGETASTLADIFDEMKRIRAIYLFDEFDALGKQREDDYDIGEAKRVVSTFLQLLDADESNSIIIAATNLSGKLDPALFRRFDDVLSFPAPDAEALVGLLRKLLRKSDIHHSEVASLASLAQGLSFAEVRSATDNARKTAVLDGRSSPTTQDVAIELNTRARTETL